MMDWRIQAQAVPLSSSLQKYGTSRNPPHAMAFKEQSGPVPRRALQNVANGID
jgi:hypothetical protein